MKFAKGIQNKAAHLKEALAAMRAAKADLDRTLVGLQTAARHFGELTDPTSKRDVRRLARYIAKLEKLKAKVDRR